MTTMYLNPSIDEIRQTYRWLSHASYGISEVRVIRPETHPQARLKGSGVVGIGFFDDEEAFARQCLSLSGEGHVYVGIQSRPQRHFSRAPNEIRPHTKGAKNEDIEVITAAVIDIDPIRPKDTSSTEEELEAAVQAAGKAAMWCKEQGLASPLRMMSGNGIQLWFALPPITLSEQNRHTVQSGLKSFETAIRNHIQNEHVRVDSIHDVARVVKVIGTVSKKGVSTSERPHRVSRALDGWSRIEDEALKTHWLLSPQQNPVQKTSLPLVQSKLSLQSTVNREIAAHIENKAQRINVGTYNFKSPTEMCGPIEKLWHEGHEDRSLAIFNMVRFFLHKGLPEKEIIDLVLEYDKRGLGKLKGRDGAKYIRGCIEKVHSSQDAEAPIAPPCHSIQSMGYCAVNRDPQARCELYEVVFDMEEALNRISPQHDGNKKEGRQHDGNKRDFEMLQKKLIPLFDIIQFQNPQQKKESLSKIQKHFRLSDIEMKYVLSHSKKMSSSSSQKRPMMEKPRMEGQIFEGDRNYFVLGSQGQPKGISSFVLKPQMMVKSQTQEWLVSDALTETGKNISSIKLPLRAFHSKRDFIRALPSFDMQWIGSDNQVQGLLKHLCRKNIPKKKGTFLLGTCLDTESPLWVGPEHVLGSYGRLEDPPVLYIENGNPLAHRICDDACSDEVFSEVAEEVFEHLLHVNLPEVVLPILGWFFATPLKPMLMKKVGSFPLLFVWATQGAGKSSLLTDIFWPLFGMKDSDPFSATETEFALLRLLSATASIPVFLDEYKPSDMPKRRLQTLHRMMRQLYRGEVEARGEPTQTVRTFPLKAPLCVAGETCPSESAILERLITATLNKNTLIHHPECRTAFFALKGRPLYHFAPRYISFCLSRNFEEDFALAHDVTKALLVQSRVPERVFENIRTMVLGVHLFEQFARDCGYDALPKDIGLEQAVRAMVQDVVETDHGVKNALDHFLEMLSVMSIQGELHLGRHYTVKDDILYIHLESAYDCFRAHAKRIDDTNELVEFKALKRLVRENLQQNGYVASDGQRVYFDLGGNRRRAVGIDFDKTDLISLDDFEQPYRPTESWGKEDKA